MMLSASLAEAKEEEKEQTLQEEITEYIYHHEKVLWLSITCYIS